MRVAALVLAVAAVPAAANGSCRDLAEPECRAERETACRRASEQMLASMKATPPGESESHRRRHAEVLAATEKAIAEGRARGEGACETHARIQRIVTHQ